MIRILNPQTFEPDFPNPAEAPGDAPIAYGGDLSSERLLRAYRSGIFPWYSQDPHIYWWSPDPRAVLHLEEFKVSRSLRKSITNKGYEVSLDLAFDAVIYHCALVPRKEATIEIQTTLDGSDTWITEQMISAYSNLHKLGFAHSVETWYENKLVGGLYGVALGGIFFGESMFSMKTDASKVSLYYLVEHLKRYDFDLIDCQETTQLLLSLGAKNISRQSFLKQLATSVKRDMPPEMWENL